MYMNVYTHQHSYRKRERHTFRERERGSTRARVRERTENTPTYARKHTLSPTHTHTHTHKYTHVRTHAYSYQLLLVEWYNLFQRALLVEWYNLLLLCSTCNPSGPCCGTMSSISEESSTFMCLTSRAIAPICCDRND